MFRRIASVTLLLTLAMAGRGLPAWAAPVALTILHTNDTHDHLESFDTKNGTGVGGVARRATYVKQVKASTKNVLLLDGGDVFQGTPLFTFFSGEADYKAITMLGYDGITVGNHDLDNGLANLQKQAKLLNVPPLSCNLVGPDGKLLFPGWRLVERGGLKIALVGIMGQNAYQAIADDKRKGLTVLDPATVLTQLIPQIRRQADLVIVLSHTGHEEEVALAGQVPGIDVIVGGHSHTRVDHPVAVKHGDRTTLVVQDFQWGEFVGRMDLVIDGGKIQSYNGDLVPMLPSIPQDPAVATMITGYSQQIARQMDEIVGHSAVEFLNSRKSEGDAPIGNLIADALRAETRADIGIMNSGGIRASLPKGAIKRGDVYSVLPFENRLVTFKAKGALLQEILDFAASRSGHSGSLQVSGLSFTVEGGKAIQVTIGGAPLDPNRDYTITTIDYLANGNDGADVFKRASDVQATGLLVRDAFFHYLNSHPVLMTPEGGRIRVRETATP